MSQTTVPSVMVAAFPGMKADLINGVVDSKVSEEASAEIPFGVMVGAGTADSGVLALAAITDDLVGVVLHSHAYAKDTELGDTGLLPEASLSVLAKGRVWVRVEDAVTPASGVHVRAVVAGAEVAGAFRGTADGSDTIDCSAFARFLTSADAGELAVVEFDVTMRSA